MITWTNAAREVLERHLATLRASLTVTGVDLEIVAANLRMHIEADAVAAGASIVDRVDVERALARMQAPRPAAVAPSRTRSKLARATWCGLAWGARAFNVVAGVVLPLVALGFEGWTGICAAELFDPIPTPWHVAAILGVAVANALALYAVFTRRTSVAQLRRVAVLNALAMGIAAFFSAWFAPITPFAVIGILAMGLGLLPLAPLLSLIVALILRRELRKRMNAAGGRLPRAWPFLVAGLAGLVALEVPGLGRAWAAEVVARGGPASQVTALQLLRWTGSGDALLPECYFPIDQERAAVRRFLFGTVSREEQQQVYYRVTGRSFNSEPAPRRGFHLAGARWFDPQDWRGDESLGTDQVGQRLKTLHLTESRLDGTLEGDAATGYLEWTLVFRNDHEFLQREARALVQLPAGAVVSRLTLWIDGEEREAAFGSRSDAREAYQRVVGQRRDPVLVTAKGADRVLVQCFPVGPKGGEMKVRLGITVPLVLDRPDRARLALPRIIEQNFSAAPGLMHAVWIESEQRLESRADIYRPENPRHAKHALHGSLSPEQFNASAASVTVDRDPQAVSWTIDRTDASRVVVQQVALQPPSTEPLAVVIDGSSGLEPTARALAEVLEELPPSFALSVSVANDVVETCPSSSARDVAVWLRARRFRGGCDATPGLQSAVEHLGGGTLLWIHGVQPLAWHDMMALDQALARPRGREDVRLLAFAAMPGPNVVLDRFSGLSRFATAPRIDDVKTDLGRVLGRWRAGGCVAVRRELRAADFTAVEPPASTQLWRLWASDEVVRRLAGGEAQREVAIQLAIAAHLVTPVTSAVVLETKQQYDMAGLEPVKQDETHAVPDATATLALLLVSIGGLILFGRCRTSRAGLRPAIRAVG